MNIYHILNYKHEFIDAVAAPTDKQAIAMAIELYGENIFVYFDEAL